MEITLEEIREKALALGWGDVGVTDATIPAQDSQAYHDWLAAGYHGELAYMENEIRCSPESLFPGSNSVIIFVTNYKQPEQPFLANSGLIASYARGKDYHHIHRKRLKLFISWLEERSNQVEIAKGFSDSFPIMEKALAAKAGLGWFGKNSLLIHRRFGTFFLLSGILTKLHLPHTGKEAAIHLPRCGSCNRCIEACPTQALVSPYKLDAKLCLSFHLIESKKPIPEAIQKRNPGYVFGCDICQDACPHNARKTPSVDKEFNPEKGVGIYLNKQKIKKIIENPETLFGTPLQRKGAKGLQDNLLSLKPRNGSSI